MTFPNSLVTTWTYETTRDLVDHIENEVDETTISKYGYVNDTIGRRTSVQKTGTAFTQTDTVTWGYDGLSQVTSAEATTDTTYDYDFTYDPIGQPSAARRAIGTVAANPQSGRATTPRKTSITEETGTPVTTIYTGNELNQYTAVTGLSPTPTHDDDGNMLTNGGRTYAWDAENRLASAESATAKLEFAYDCMSRRIEKRTYTGTPAAWTLSETRRFLYDGWHPIAEYTLQSVDDDTAPALVATHLWGLDLSQSIGGAGGVGGLLRSRAYTIDAEGDLVPGTRHFPTYDANGNVSEYVDSADATVAHYEYSPFGRLDASSGRSFSPFRFSTKYLDSYTGLYYYGYRYYSPKLGRWISRDPIEENGSVNLSVFCVNDAIHFTDVLGKEPFTLVSGGKTIPLWQAQAKYSGQGLRSSEPVYPDCKRCGPILPGGWSRR